MKRLTFILFLMLAAVPSRAANYLIQTNAVIVKISDSLNQDSSHSDGVVTGFRQEAIQHAFLQMYYPYLHLWFANASQSGATFINYRENFAKFGLPLFAHDFNHYQHIGIVHSTDNGGASYTNQSLAFSNLFQGPLWITNNTAMTNEGGWCSTNTIEWIAEGAPPTATSGGSFQIAHNDAAIFAGTNWGVMGVDVLNPLYLSWSNQFQFDGGEANLNILQTGPKAGHFINGSSYSWAQPLLDRLITDTNVSTACVDWSGSVVWTNGCVISSVTRSGNSLFFDRFDVRLPGGYYRPGTNIFGKTITNDMRGAFVVNPADGNKWQFTFKLTNCPAGTYQIFHNGTLVWTVTDTQLTVPNGLNFFTNNVGPYWDKRLGVLGLICDLEHVDQVTLDPGSAGDAEGLVSYGSYANSYWPSNHGDTLITAMAAKNTQIATNFTAIHNLAAPANIAWEIRFIPAAKAPFRVEQTPLLHIGFMDGKYWPISDDWTNAWTPVVFAGRDMDELERTCLTVPRTWERYGGHLGVAVTRTEPSQFYRVMFQPN